MSLANTSSSIPIDELNVKNIHIACQVKAKNVRCFINIIRSLTFTNNTEIHFSPTGMKFIAEDSQFFQGSAYVKKGFFFDFRYRCLTDDLLNFGVDLSKFTEFLTAFIDNDMCLLKIVYYGDERPLAFIVNQTDSFHSKVLPKNDQDTNTTFIDVPNDDNDEAAGHVVTEYIITTKNSINPVDFNALAVDPLSLIVIETRPFLECLQEFDSKTITDIQISIRKQQIVMRSVGVQQCDTTVKIRYEHKFVQRHDVDKCTKFSYKYSCFKFMIKALHMASRLSMETFVSGLIRFQLMVKSEEPDTEAVYLEFDVGANIDSVDDDENDDNDEDK